MIERVVPFVRVPFRAAALPAGAAVGEMAMRRAPSSWKILALVAALFAGCAQPSPSVPVRANPPAPASGVAASWHTLALGVCEDYPEETRSLTRARADLAAAHAAGATVLRIAFGWDAMEPERGVYDWSFWDEFVRMATRDFGVRLIPYVCYTPKWAASDPGENFWRSPPRDPADFGRFMRTLVAHYRDAIHSWELWNEPDNPAYWSGTPAQFAALVRTGSAAVRAVDPRATVVLGGIATRLEFLETLLRDQHLAPAIDVVNLHTYFETWHPDPIESLPGYVARAAEIVRSAGEGEPLWMAETGYSSVGARAQVSEVYRARFAGEHTEAAQADALARTVVLAAATNEISLLAWYRLNDLAPRAEVIGDDNNRHLGLRRAEGAAKPALAALAQLTRWFAAPYRVQTAETAAAEGTRGEPEVRVFALRDGRAVVAAWLAAPDGARVSAMPMRDARAGAVSIRWSGARVREMRVTNAAGHELQPWRRLARSGDGRIAVELSLRGGEVRFAELRP